MIFGRPARRSIPPCAMLRADSISLIRKDACGPEATASGPRRRPEKGLCSGPLSVTRQSVRLREPGRGRHCSLAGHRGDLIPWPERHWPWNLNKPHQSVGRTFSRPRAGCGSLDSQKFPGENIAASPLSSCLHRCLLIVSSRRMRFRAEASAQDSGQHGGLLRCPLDPLGSILVRTRTLASQPWHRSC
jgi:hypothetical protein